MPERLSPREVIERHRKKVMAIPLVQGVAFGRPPGRPDHPPCILVYVPGKEWPLGLPKELEGYEVKIVTVGKGFRPL